MSKTRMTMDIVGNEIVAKWRGMEVRVPFKEGEVRKAMKIAEDKMYQEVERYYHERKKK